MSDPTTVAGRALLEAFTARAFDAPDAIHLNAESIIRHAIPRIEAEAYERGAVAGMAMERYAPTPPDALEFYEDGQRIMPDDGIGRVPTPPDAPENIVPDGWDSSAGFVSTLAPTPPDALRVAAEWALQLIEALEWEDDEPPTEQIDALRAALEETP